MNKINITTRAALLTPPGVSAIATIQITGPQSLDILQNIFRPHRQSSGWQPPSRRRGGWPKANDASNLFGNTPEKLHYGTLYENEDILDSVIIATEPVRQTVDIHCHGGPRIVQRLLMLLRKQNVEITPWQQLRAADSIADEVEFTLPLAKTRLAVLAIASQHPGGLSAWIRSQIAVLQNKPNFLPHFQQNLKEMLSTFQIAQRLLLPATVVMVGPVNVGKSTLANALTGRKQSITADLPGTTRDWTAQLVDMNGLPVHLIDTPGQRDPDDALENHALQLAEKQIAQADLIVLVIEAGASENEQIVKQRAKLPVDKDILIVANKSDLLDRRRTDEEAVAQSEGYDYIYVSALEESNLDLLRTAIANHFGLADFDPQQPLIFTPRQYDLFNKIHNIDSIEDVIQTLHTLLDY